MDFYKVMFTAYLITIAIETPVLLVGLSPRHSIGRRVFCGVWLTACTYPFVWIVFPQFLDPDTQRIPYLIVAETFAPVAECAIFWLAFGEWQKVRSGSLSPDSLDLSEFRPGIDDSKVRPPPHVESGPSRQTSLEAAPPGIETDVITRARRSSMWRNFLTITLANLASFGIGELLIARKWISFVPAE